MPLLRASARPLARNDMTRFATIGSLVLALSFTAVAEDKKDVPKELQLFQGKWKVVEASRGGVAAPKEAIESLRFTFDGTKLIVAEKEREEMGSYSVDPKADPTAIDLVNAKGEKVLGIYKFDKDGKFTLCIVKGKNATRPKGFDDKEADVLVLEKVK